MADEAITKISFDAALAKKGADEFVAASEKVIAADKAVEAAEGKSAAAVEQAAAKKSTARRKAATDAKTTGDAEAQAVESTTTRVATSTSSLTRTLEAAARRADPFATAIRRAKADLELFQNTAAAGGPKAAFALEQVAAAQRKLNDAQRAMQVRDAGGISTEIQAAANQSNALLAVSQRLAPVLAAAFSLGAIRSFASAIVEAADQVALLEGRITALTGSTSAAKEAVAGIFAITAQTGASVDDTGQTFARFLIAAQAIGKTRVEVLQLTETVQKLGIIGGATTQQLSAGSVQLAQALASGALRGDELNSVMENMPLVAKQIADGLGVSIGRLREMGAAGQLTADIIFGALQKGQKQVDEQFAALPVTVQRAAGQASAAWTQFSAALDQSIGLSRALAASLQGIARILSEMSKPRTGESIAAGLQQQITSLERQASEQRAMGLEGQARRIDANVVRLREALAATQGLVAAEQEAASVRTLAERSAVAQAQADTAAAKAVKDATAARKELDTVLAGLDPKYKAAKSFSEQVMILDAALAEGAIGATDHARAVGLAIKAHDEAIKKADEHGKKRKQEKLTWDELNQSIRDATAVALEHEKRLAEGSKATEAILKVDQDLADQLTRDAIPAWQKANAELVRLERLYEQGGITADTYAHHIARVNQELREADPAYKEAQRAAENYQKEVQRQIGHTTDRIVDIGGDILFDALTGKSKNFWESFKELALRTFSQIAAEAVLRPIALQIATEVVGGPIVFIPAPANDDEAEQREAA